MAAGAVGAGIASFRRPGPELTSGVQHFAAGVVLAAVAGEVLPDLRNQGHLWAVVLGFAVGVAVLLTLGAYSRRMEAATDACAAASSGRLPIGLLVAVGVDLLLDGLLVGLGVTLGSNQGLILTIALTLEILFLGLSVSLSRRIAGSFHRGWCRRRRRTAGSSQPHSARRGPGLRRGGAAVPGGRGTAGRSTRKG